MKNYGCVCIGTVDLYGSLKAQACFAFCAMIDSLPNSLLLKKMRKQKAPSTIF
jgi:hypothetical protein